MQKHRRSNPKTLESNRERARVRKKHGMASNTETETLDKLVLFFLLAISPVCRRRSSAGMAVATSTDAVTWISSAAPTAENAAPRYSGSISDLYFVWLRLLIGNWLQKTLNSFICWLLLRSSSSLLLSLICFNLLMEKLELIATDDVYLPLSSDFS